MMALLPTKTKNDYKEVFKFLNQPEHPTPPALILGLQAGDSLKCKQGVWMQHLVTVSQFNSYN